MLFFLRRCLAVLPNLQPLNIFTLMALVLVYSPFVSSEELAAIYKQQLTFNEAENERFFAAEKMLIKTTSEKEFLKAYTALAGYPLQPYLQQKYLLKNITLSNEKLIDDFLTQYKGTPLDWPLRKKWLNYLDKKNKSARYLKYYKPTSNVGLTCKYYLYQLSSGVSKHLVLPKVTKLWTVGKSQNKVCDPLFKEWQVQGYRTNDVIWQRIELAANGGKVTLLPYLIKLLPAEQRAKAELWRSVRINPSYVSRLAKFTEKDGKEAEILTYGLSRYIWRDPDNAIKTFEQAKRSFPFTDKQLSHIHEKFAVALSSKNHRNANQWLEKLNDDQYSTNIIQWHITRLLRTGDWPDINKTLKTFPKSQQKRIQWRYWYGRSLLEIGDIEQGKAVLTNVADERHYYGFLAAGQLETSINLNHEAVAISEQEMKSALGFPAAKRTILLFDLGRYVAARKEWNYWQKQLNDREKLAAAKAAYDRGWYDRAIFTLAKVKFFNDTELRFPLAFESDITAQAKHNNINSAWAFSIARRESSFMNDAQSPVGASGLMQLMPATAKQLNKKKISRKKLYEPKKNITLGTKYLKELLAQFDNNQILATAAYNAGPHRVNKWLKERSSLPADIWIETIPYKETREYVKSVMAYQKIYLLKTNQTTPLFQQLSTMVIE